MKSVYFRLPTLPSAKTTVCLFDRPVTLTTPPKARIINIVEKGAMMKGAEVGYGEGVPRNHLNAYS